MIIKKLLIALFLTAFLCCDYGLLHAQKVSAADSAWFTEMANKTNQLINENPQRADSFAQAYYARARALNNDEYSGKGACLVHMGVSLLKPEKANAWYDTAQVYLQRSKNYLWNGYLNMNYGNILNGRYSFESGIRYLLKSISYFEQAKDTTQLTMAYSGVANAFHDFGNYEKGKEYAQKGLEIIQAQKKPSARSVWYLWNVLGINYDDNKEYDKAIASHQKALKAISGNDLLLAVSYNNIGNTYKKKRMLPEAEKYFLQSFELDKKLQDDYQYATIYGNLGDITLLQKKYDVSRRYLDSCLHYSERSGSPEKLKDAYEYNASWYEATGDYKRSLLFTRQFIHLKDSLENVEKAGVVYDAQERYESAKKDKENQALHADNELKTIEKNKAVSEKRTILVLALVFIALLSALVYLLYRNKINRVKRSEEQKTNQALFTGEQNERIRIARDLHDGVGQMLSLAKINLSAATVSADQLQQSIQLIDDTIGEVRNISHNLIPEDLNFGLYAALETMAEKVNRAGDPQMQVNISEQARQHSLKKENELTIYRIVQEVVNNMIRHSEAEIIHLTIMQQNQKILLSIKDNGKGMDAGSIENAQGIGWKNIRARVNLMDGELKIQSEKITGTHIEIAVPV